MTQLQEAILEGCLDNLLEPRNDEPAPSFEERLRQARVAGDMLEAIRVKQEAAAAGLILL